MTTVINLFAGPGAGKSSSAAGLFFEMKNCGYKCELVTEYAKDVTYDTHFNKLQNQLYITAKQESRLRRLIDQVDYIITDSPLLISLAYVQGIYAKPHFISFVTELFDSYNNYNVWVQRVKPYAAYGRSQTEAEARKLDEWLHNQMKGRIHLTVNGDKNAPLNILNALGLVVI